MYLFVQHQIKVIKITKQKTFLNVEKVTLEDSLGNIVFLGIPTEEGHVFREGTAKAPDAIRNASLMYYYPGYNGSYDPEQQKHILRNVKMTDLSNINLNQRNCSSEEIIKEYISKILSKDALPVILGGDHSITYAILSAYNKSVNVIHLDAHGDFQRYDESDVAPCGTVIRKVCSLPNIQKIIQVGIRGYLNSKQGIQDSIKRGNIVIPCNKLKVEGIETILSHINKGESYYITFDSDFLDPSICPGTTVPELGGISYDLARDLLYAVANRAKIVGMDFVELNPMYDPTQISAICASRLIIGTLGEISKNLKR